MIRNTCVFALLFWPPQTWGADTPKVSFHIETVVGSSLNGDGGLALAGEFSPIQGIAVDRLGNVFIADTANHRVRRVSGSIVNTVAGTGVPGFSGDGASALTAQLNLPYGVAVDPSGNLYVADLGNNRVRRISADGTITTIAGTGRKASSPDGAAPTDTSLLSPRNVAIDWAGNLYIAEFEGHRVRKLSTDGRIATVAGTGVAGFSGDGDRAAAAQLSYPAGLAFDRNGALYIADSGNNAVRKIYADLTIGTVLGRTSSTALFTPLSLAVDSAGTLYAGDSTYAVRAFTSAGKWTTFAGTGAPGYSGDGALAIRATLTSVGDLACDTGGSLFIADGVRVRRVDPAGTIVSVAGDGYVHSVGDGGPVLSAILYQPAAVALDSSGILYIADSGTQRIRMAATGIVSTLAGTGTPAKGAVTGNAASLVALNTPAGVAVDPAGNVIVADTYNHRILTVDPTHRLRALAGTGTAGFSSEGTPPLQALLRAPRAVCTSRSGDVYIVDTSNHRVLRLSVPGTLQAVAGNGSPGWSGDGGPARLAQLNTPGACAVDTAGRLFIADTANHAIRKVDTAGTISTLTGDGVAGAYGDDGPAIHARLASPRGVTADDTGNVYIADSDNHRIRLIAPDGVIRTIAGNGLAGLAGDSGLATKAQLNSPQGLCLDGAGNLYFADNGNNRIRRLLLDPTDPGGVQTSGVTLVNALNWQTGAIAPGELVSIVGADLGPGAGVSAALEQNALPTTLSGVEVHFGSTVAPLFYVQSGQINAQVPYTVAGVDSVPVQVLYQGKLVGSTTVQVVPAAPGVFATAINPDGSLNSQSNPVGRAQWVVLYATGEGLTDGPNLAGVSAAAPYPHPLQPISLTIAGIGAEILYAGSAPGLIGVLQINARVPGGFVPPGETKAVLTVGLAAAPAISIWLQ
jgi:uncharacterized protein (TIGR03437 family)